MFRDNELSWFRTRGKGLNGTEKTLCGALNLKQ
jgi:hypothetical protein